MSDQPSHRLPRTVIPERYLLELVPDLAAATFKGRVDIEVRVEAATDTVVLNAAELDIPGATFTGPDGRKVTGKVSTDEATERATISLDAPLEAGSWQLALEFTGVLNDKLRGFYRSTYTADDGTVRTLATTQFEAADARRAFPCWDEPDFKATFAVTLVVEEGLTAISNGDVVSDEPIGDGTRRVRFAETMVMSTYLVAFIVGEFELTEPRDVQGVPLRVAAPPGRSHLTPYAVAAAEHALTYLAGYFEIPYPASKIDHVAIPDFAFGAMENLGCVTYRETALLLDEARASQLELQRVATVIAHETAHMWFGDLVTMKWWNGIWLNEAFATFMELKTTDALRPQWDVWTAFGAGKAAAMVTDGLRATRPVEFEVGEPAEADAMFDVLTYQKGGSVLRMLEQYLGEEQFRKGIARYLKQHSYGNTETTDLWDAIEAASGEPVRATMDTWIFQGGYPLVSVKAGDDGRSLVVSQQRFVYDGEPAEGLWGVPLSLRASVGGTVETRRVLLDEPSATISFDGPVDWAVLNAGGTGFYRVRYSPDLLAALSSAGLAGLAPLERIGLLGDTWAAVLAGQASVADWARLVGALGDEDDPDVWGAALAPMALLEVVATDAQLPALAAFAHRVVGPAFARLGWDAAPGEADRAAICRGRLLGVLGTVGADPEVRAEAARRFGSDRDGGDALAPDLRGAVVNVVAAAGGAGEWEALLERYTTVTNPQEKVRYLFALTQTPDPALLRRTLDLCLSDEVRNQDAPYVVPMVLANRAGGAWAWDWVTGHWDAVLDRYPANLLIRLLEGITALVDPDVAARVEEWLSGATVPVGGPRVAQLTERMRVNGAFARRVGPGLAAALEG
ncbi:M1 family metallopeptidase [Acidiferrimicrobium sp. IK]|uniref:M1 family metallopeptidase n=1 Tax=Acidiferrimicrobium sp. IK TaxID=2871700 RepID=UPI0021CB2E42|nr:M1 family metallopeptidase [Acidiferrimicrobium sp. IK]MCU4185432.1 M1 family metallopeptidase [Acidiferrimicrobium sp. IK]